MRWTDIVNYDELKKTIDILKPNGQLFEVRVIASSKKVLSGYFTDSETLLKAFENIDLRSTNVYITLNEVNEALYSRSQCDKFVANTNTTNDQEIDSFQWLFIDFDPVRPAGISSSDDELALALERKDAVKAYLHEFGFSDPVEAISGNGYHLLYRISLPNNDESIQIVSGCLSALANKFNTDAVKVDTTNCNPSRICKLHGTLAQKGANTKKRPHRMSRLLNVPGVIQTTSKDFLLALSAQNEQPAKIAPQTRAQKKTSSEFDLRDFMLRNGMTSKEDIGRDCTMYLLDSCPFNSNHMNGDAKIFHYTNGAIAFKCHHNSCKSKTWQDVRTLYEPDAYDGALADARIEDSYQKHKKQKKEKEETAQIRFEGDDEPKPAQSQHKRKVRKLKKAADLLLKNLPEPRVFVGVGDELPLLVEGTCILSAKPKLGKSWLVLGMCLAVSTGADFLGYKTNKCSTLYLDLETSEQLEQKRLKKALNGAPVPENFYMEQEADSVDKGFCEQIEDYLKEDPAIGIVVIDVFQIIRSNAKSVKETEYEHAYRDITPLNELAQKHHIAIILVCHDRKAIDADDPFSNILGSTGLQGAATQMMVMFRKRKDDPIHISIKGKTIDGLPELDVNIKNGQWVIAEGVSDKDREKASLNREYMESNIRKAVVRLACSDTEWRGRCASIVNAAASMGIPITESNRDIGGFLHRHQGRFLAEDSIVVEIIDHGTGSKEYSFYVNNKSTIPTIPNFEQISLKPLENIHYF